MTIKIIKIFSIESNFLKLLASREIKKKILFSSIYIILFLFVSTFLFYLVDKDGIQISNFIFSFVLFFEMCMKIADSEIFINWIGESLDKSLRYLIMFVICLNCTYFFTRITEQIINSSGI